MLALEVIGLQTEPEMLNVLVRCVVLGCGAGAPRSVKRLAKYVASSWDVMAGNGEMIVVTLLTGIGILNSVLLYTLAGDGAASVRDTRTAAVHMTASNMTSSHRTDRVSSQRYWYLVWCEPDLYIVLSAAKM